MALVFTAAVMWSTAGLFVRLLDLDVWTILAWRSLFAAASLAVIAGLRHRGAALSGLLASGPVGLLAIALSTVSIGGYVISLKLTSVANVMVIYATVPLITAGIAWLWMRERIDRRVLVASVIALCGVAVMAGTQTRMLDLAGNAVALIMTLAFGMQLVMARRYRTLDMGPVNAVGALLVALLCLPLMQHDLPGTRDLVVLALFGITTTSVAYSLFMIGGRYIPSGEAGLIGMIDVVLAPFWVWLLFAEDPGAAALLGGALVLAATGYYLWGQRRKAAVD